MCRITQSGGEDPPGRFFVATRCAAAVLAATLVATPALSSDGVELLGLSLPSKSRAGTDVAIGDTALSQLVNPASVGLFDGPRFDLAFELVMPDIRWEAPLGVADNQVRHVPIAGFASVHPLNERLSIGFAAHVKSGLLSEFDQRHLLIPWMRREVGADVRDLAVAMNLAWRVDDRLTVGGGPTIEFASARFSEVLGPLDFEFDGGSAIGIGFQAGAMYRLTPTVTLGASYRSPTWFSDLSGETARASLLGIVPLRFGAARISEFMLPQRAAVGVAWRPLERLLLSAEARYVDYSNSTLSGAEVHVSKPFPLVAELPVGYRDQWIFKFGGEYRLDEHWVLGAGYSYATNPIRKDALAAMASVPTTHHAALGLRYETRHWYAGVGYAIAFSQSMSADGVSRVPLGIDFAFSHVRHAQQSVFAGVGYSW